MRIPRLLSTPLVLVVTVGLAAACSSGSDGASDHVGHHAEAEKSCCGTDGHASHDHASSAPAGGATLVAAEPSDDYPLDTCVVSGENLDAMGARRAFAYEGEEVQFCCAGCVDEFREDPAAFMSKVHTAKNR